MDNESYLHDIEQDLSDGKKLGITGTPTWFFNGMKVEGGIPYDIFIQIIEEYIK